MARSPDLDARSCAGGGEGGGGGGGGRGDPPLLARSPGRSQPAARVPGVEGRGERAVT